MSDTFEAEVLATFGRGLLVELANGEVRKGRPFGRRLDIVCGDRVRCTVDAHGELMAREVLPRRSALWRSNARGDSEVLAANLDLLCVVIAPLPEPDFFMVDRYLSAAESAGLGALLVLNKHDLPLADAARAELATYARIGYSPLEVGAKSGTGIEALALRLASHRAALVGQSGVGKSSLIRRLASDGDAIITGTLARDDEGRHTTTASRRYLLAGGGMLIDSPGVRDFAPSIDHLEAASLGFIEVSAAAGGCRFQDCRHRDEPKCAVRAGVEAGSIAPRRYESYRRLRRLYEELNARRHPSQRLR
jgi:ribosome biogenesis GTPase